MQPDVSARVLAGRARLAPPARRERDMRDRQLRRLENLAGVEIGDGHLGGRDEEEPVVGVVRLVLELRELRGADHRLAPHQVRRCDLAVPVLARDVEHERRQRALQTRAVAAQDREPRAADLRGALEIEDAEPLADLVVRQRIEVERSAARPTCARRRCPRDRRRRERSRAAGWAPRAAAPRRAASSSVRRASPSWIRMLERGERCALLVRRLHRASLRTRRAALREPARPSVRRRACLGVEREQLIDRCASPLRRAPSRTDSGSSRMRCSGSIRTRHRVSAALRTHGREEQHVADGRRSR